MADTTPGADNKKWEMAATAWMQAGKDGKTPGEEELNSVNAVIEFKTKTNLKRKLNGDAKDATDATANKRRLVSDGSGKNLDDLSNNNVLDKNDQNKTTNGDVNLNTKPSSSSIVSGELSQFLFV